MYFLNILLSVLIIHNAQLIETDDFRWLLVLSINLSFKIKENTDIIIFVYFTKLFKCEHHSELHAKNFDHFSL